MADIVMCKGAYCPLKESCHRYTAKACEYAQSYFVTPPFDGKGCDSYWDDKGYKRYNIERENK